jgi:hypothetical protein
LVRPGARSVAQVGGDLEIVDTQQGVLVAAISDAVVVELADEPILAVVPDLDSKRQPGLQLDVDETKLSVNEVEVQLRTGPFTGTTSS